MIDNTIQKYMRSAASRARQVEQIGPFLATFTTSSTNPYLNYAIPEENAVPTADDVSALVTAYRRRGLLPRLEYLPHIAPGVEEVLLAHGFTVEGRQPLMVCPVGSERECPLPADIALLVPTSDEELFAMLAVQHEAFGDAPPTVADMQRGRESLSAGGLAILACDTLTGEPVGGGNCTVPLHRTTEVVGIAIRDVYRRRGIASALTARLVHDAFAAGVETLFLTAGSDASAQVYSRVGFITMSEMLFISQV